MSDYGDFCRDLKEQRKSLREKYGISCPQCPKVQPRRIPSILLPQQVCKVCGYRDPRPRLSETP